MTKVKPARKTISIGAMVSAAVLALVLHDASVAAGSDLSAFLERAEQMSLFPKPVRADIKITRDEKPVDAAVLIFDPTANREFFALKSSGWRALMPIGWGEGKAVTSAGKSPVTHSSDEPLGTTGLRGMEFFPFWKTDYTTAFVSDSNRTEKTVTLYAKTGLPYVLFVITFDKEKLVPLAIKYYRDNMNNLVRLRRDSDFVMVGSRPRPRHIELRDFTENTNVVYEFTWRTLDSVPEGLTKDQTFYKAQLDWPTEPIAAR